MFGLSISNIPGSGLGLVVDRNVTAGELLLRVPHKLLLMGERVTGMGGTNALALALLTEKYKGSTSQWAPYIQFLSGMDPVGTPLFFNASERSLLRGTDVLGWSLSRESNVIRTHRYLRESGTHNVPKDLHGQDLAWALSIAWSRGFTISTSECCRIPARASCLEP